MLDDDKLIVRRWLDAVAVFSSAAHSINYNKEIDPHEAYKEELEERYQRTVAGGKEKEEKRS